MADSLCQAHSAERYEKIGQRSRDYCLLTGEVNVELNWVAQLAVKKVDPETRGRAKSYGGLMVSFSAEQHVHKLLSGTQFAMVLGSEDKAPSNGSGRMREANGLSEAQAGPLKGEVEDPGGKVELRMGRKQEAWSQALSSATYTIGRHLDDIEMPRLGPMGVFMVHIWGHGHIEVASTQRNATGARD
ncbi:hypothetical protein NM208_g9603 [Fusarium decemcellulare]|uniref:Uncharacterized protein n=1 Tax=Fusarium decemcellulare TaxID=57161 RepID=A0ACC1S0Z6_9HYPO|nr:hypothetical protein NM208_g9603 [Fusarium decemcellulare]